MDSREVLNVQEEMMGARGDFVEQIVAESGSFLHTAVAFANGRGGRIIFYGESGRGFSADAEIIPYIDEITRQIFDSCEPRIFPRVGVELQDGRQVVVVEIFPGMEKPYFIKEAGMMDGAYVRVGGATRLAEPYQVQELLLSGTNSSADQLAAENAVDDVEIEEFCRMMYREAEKRRADADGVARLQKEDLLAWKLLREEDGVYRATNGWHLLMGTAEELFPEGFIQCAEYLGTTRLDFVGGEEFAGSLTEQVDGAAAYMYGRLAARGAGAYGLAELSEELLRRLIARAVCQRNYAAPGRISLVLYEDRLEITTPGLLEEDMTIWKLKTGFSKIRNRAIAAAFLYMGMMTGFQSILPELYRAAKEARLPEPAVVTLGDSVRINLYCRAEEEAAPEESAEGIESVEPAREEAAAPEEDLVQEPVAAECAEPVQMDEAAMLGEDSVPEAAAAPEEASAAAAEAVEATAAEAPETPEAPDAEEGAPASAREAEEETEPLPEEAREEEPEAAEWMDAATELDLEPAPELKLEIASLADLKADAAVVEEEAAEVQEEKPNAAQQELSFTAEDVQDDSLDERLIQVIRENPKVTQKALKEALGISIATVKRMTTALQKAGVLERTGTNRSGEWHVLKD